MFWFSLLIVNLVHFLILSGLLEQPASNNWYILYMLYVLYKYLVHLVSYHVHIVCLWLSYGEMEGKVVEYS